MNFFDYFTQGLRNTIKFKGRTNFSFRGEVVPVYPNTVIDTWYMGDFTSATYQIAVEYGANDVEIITVIVSARVNQASISVFGRTNIGRDLVQFSTSINNSNVSLLISPLNAITSTTASIVQSSTASSLQLGSSRTPVSATWTISNGTISLQATGLPYHSYGNYPTNLNTPIAQNYNVTFTLRGGTSAQGTQPFVGTGPIGYWLNGVAITSPIAQPADLTIANPFSPTWQFNASYADNTLLGLGQDIAGGHSDGNGVYHYHDFSFANAWLSGTGYSAGYNATSPNAAYSTGVADAKQIPYLNGTLTHPDGHSKIVGWAADGFPIYGPFGYNIATSTTSGTRRMVSGYILNSTRTSLAGLLPSIATYPLGTFVQDFTFANIGDLDSHNGRYCITPDYPNGTYAYFVSVDAALVPAYPYVIGTTYYGTPFTTTDVGGYAPTAVVSTSSKSLTGIYATWSANYAERMLKPQLPTITGESSNIGGESGILDNWTSNLGSNFLRVADDGGVSISSLTSVSVPGQTAMNASFILDTLNIANTDGALNLDLNQPTNTLTVSFTSTKGLVVTQNFTSTITSGSANNITIGSVVPRPGTISALSITSTNILAPVNGNVSIIPSGSSTVTIKPAVTGAIDKMKIGSVQGASAKFSLMTLSQAPTLNTHLVSLASVQSRLLLGAI